MPASVPNGRTFCRADKRPRTLPRYLAPSLPTARLLDSPRAVPSRPALCPPIAKHLILI
jgi:hypothetical protein